MWLQFLACLCLYLFANQLSAQTKSPPPQPQIAHASSNAAPKAQMTHEEELVRIAYAKLSYAAQIGILWHAVAQHEGWPSIDDSLDLGREMNQQLKFELSGFKVGNLKDIGDDSWTTLVEGPVDILLTVPHTSPVSFESPTSKIKINIVYADVAWKRPSSDAIPSKEDAARSSNDPSVKNVVSALKKPSGGEWSRYASFSVVAMLRNRTVSYRATFLFSSAKNEDVLPLDYAVTNGVGLFINSRMYPAALIETAFREIPLIQGWIAASEVTGCKKTRAPEVCCNPVTGQCGLPIEDIQRSMNVPIDPDTRWLVTRKKPQLQKKGELK